MFPRRRRRGSVLTGVTCRVDRAREGLVSLMVGNEWTDGEYIHDVRICSQRWRRRSSLGKPGARELYRTLVEWSAAAAAGPPRACPWGRSDVCGGPHADPARPACGGAAATDISGTRADPPKTIFRETAGSELGCGGEKARRPAPASARLCASRTGKGTPVSHAARNRPDRAAFCRT
jgi:hypothetical protein